MNILKSWILFIFIFTSCIPVFATDQNQAVSIVYNRGIAPIKFTDSDNNPSGILNDYWKLLDKKANINFNFMEADTFGESLEMVKDGRADIHAGIFYTEERAEFLDYSEPVLNLKYYLYSSHDLDPPNRLADVKGLFLGTVQGGYTENEIKKIIPENRLIVYEDFKSMFEAALNGEIKVFVSSDIHLNYYLSVNNRDNHFRHGKDYLYEQTYYGASAKGKEGLIEKIRFSQTLLTDIDSTKLKNKWLNFKAADAFVPGINIFTEEEIAWMQKQRTITLGSDYKWAPFDFADSGGQHSGLSSDIIKLIEQKSGLKINVETGIWSEILERMKKGELDGLACAVATDERKEYLTFTPPYLSTPTAIFIREGTENIGDIQDLSGKTVSVNEGSYMHDWLKTRYPKINLHLTTSNTESIQAVSYFRADAFMGNLAVANHVISQKLLTNLKVAFTLPNKNTDISVAIDKNQPVLQEIINKALESISYEEKLIIQNKWYIESTEEKIVLSENERSWLERNPVIRVAGDPNQPPTSYRDEEGNYIGIIPDIFKRITEKGDLHFEIVPTNYWSDTIELMRLDKIDIIDGIEENSERREFMNFSDVYLNMDIVIITRDDNAFIKKLENIRDKTIGIVKDYNIEYQLSAEHIHLKPVLYNHPKDGLKDVSNGILDVFLIDIPTFEYYSQKSSLSNLKISGFTPYSFNFAIGVKKDAPELVSILNKTLGMISQKEKSNIYTNWVTLEKPLIDYSLLWGILLGAVVLFAVIFYWNRSLAEQVTLRKKAELEALNASRIKSDFLANMSHEIRTPMNAIIGLGSLLAKTELNPKQRDYSEKIGRSARNLLGIINDILDFSKIEADKMDIEEIDFNLTDVMENLSSMIGNKVVNRGLELIFNQNTDVPPNLIGDPLRLGQILLNLTNNAVKFTEKGEIEVSVKVLTKDDTEAMLRFDIRDTGIGLTQDQVGKLFKSFSQADTSTTRKYGGTGLGLTISKKLSELMGGYIGVESKHAKGSTFYFTARFGIGKERVKRTAPENLKGLNVLVVDDNETCQDVMTSYLEDFSFNVTTVGNGNLAIRELVQAKAAEGKEYDLVLMDYQMPGMNGIETSRKIREELENVESPKIVMVTSFGREDIMDQAQQVNLDGFLIKPVSPSMLFDTVMEVFGRYQGIEKRSTTREKRPEGFRKILGARILLAEDNEINQQVAVETLEAEGFYVEVANDGRETLDMLDHGKTCDWYDLILMDLQMPVMDGFEATRKIREIDGFKELAIIAMTADAMTGVREKVIDAGMNDYVTKPIVPKNLWAALTKWIKPGNRKLPEGFKKPWNEVKGQTDDTIIIPAIEGLNVEEGLSHVSGNKKLYLNLLVKFRDGYGETVREIEEAIVNNDRELAVRLAHTVKGVAGNIGAKDVQQAAAVVESGIKNETGKDIDFEKLEAVLSALIGNLKRADLDLKEDTGSENSKTEIDPNMLKELLEELKPMLEKRKPKPAKEIIEKISGFTLPDSLSSEFEKLASFVSKYKFKEAMVILKVLREKYTVI